MKTFNASELRQVYESMTGSIRCQCTLSTEMVGGQPADERGVRAFVEYQMKVQPTIANPDWHDGSPATVHELLKNEEFEKLVHQVMGEIGDREVAPPEGELAEKITYGVNVIRHDENGPWLGDWMVKACMKQAASRLNLFFSVKGTKGDMAEAGEVRAAGISAIGKHQQRIYVRTSDGSLPAPTYFQRFPGRVSTPQGSTSIVRDSECIGAGNRFEFEFRILPERFKENDIVQMLALAQNFGIGSTRSLERGKFVIDQAEVELEIERKRGGLEKKAKPPKKVSGKEIAEEAARPENQVPDEEPATANV
jgi:hypothetical protein